MKKKKQLCSFDNCQCYHPSLLISVNLRVPKWNVINGKQRKQWNFRKADYLNLYNYLTGINWTFLNEIADVNRACEAVYEKLNEALNLYVPKTFRDDRTKFPPWFTA